MVASLDLHAFRDEAEAFLGELDREYYLHYSGQQDDYGIEAIYERHADLFTREAVEALRDEGNQGLLEFSAQGLIGQETKAEAAELARREAALEIEVDGEKMPLRQSAVVQANEPDADRRAAIQDARIDVAVRELVPLQIQNHERAAALAKELGWSSMLELCEQLSGIDLGALE